MPWLPSNSRPAVVLALGVLARDLRARDVRADAGEGVGLGDVGNDAGQRLPRAHAIALAHVETLDHAGDRRLDDHLALGLDDAGLLDEHLHVAPLDGPDPVGPVRRAVGAGIAAAGGQAAGEQCGHDQTHGGPCLQRGRQASGHMVPTRPTSRGFHGRHGDAGVHQRPSHAARKARMASVTGSPASSYVTTSRRGSPDEREPARPAAPARDPLHRNRLARAVRRRDRLPHRVIGQRASAE